MLGCIKPKLIIYCETKVHCIFSSGKVMIKITYQDNTTEVLIKKAFINAPKKKNNLPCTAVHTPLLSLRDAPLDLSALHCLHLNHHTVNQQEQLQH